MILYPKKDLFMGASITMSDVGVVYRFFAVLEAKLSLSSLLSGHRKQAPHLH